MIDVHHLARRGERGEKMGGVVREEPGPVEEIREGWNGCKKEMAGQTFPLFRVVLIKHQLESWGERVAM